MESLPADEAARQLLRWAGQTADYAVIFLDADLRVRWWNDGAETVLGYTAAEMIGQALDPIFTPEDRARGTMEQERAIALRVGSAEDDRWQVRKDGSRFFASGVLTRVCDESGAVVGYLKTLRDRNDLREQVEVLRNQLAEATRAAARKDAFIATLSHELRNPLGPLAAAAHLIRMASVPAPEVEHALQVVDRQVALLKRLVDDLLDMTRVASGKITLAVRSIDLTDVVSQSVAAARSQGATARAPIEVILPPHPMPVRGDPDRLLQVFDNLVGNALKFTPPEGRIWVKGTVEADEVVVRVEDTGAGLSPQMVPRIFDMFTQAEETRDLSPGGLGIGLAVVKDLVALHGGSVQVRSEGLGKGSEFAVRLPMART